MTPKKIVSIAAVILAVILLLQNTQVVTIRLLFWKISMSQIILLPLMMAIGFAIGYFFSAGRSKKNGFGDRSQA